MIIDHIANYNHGWFVGNFNPAIVNSCEVEVAFHNHKRGDKSDGHFHKIATEINVVTYGKVSVNNITLSAGQLWVTYPGEKPLVKFLEDSGLIVVKCPSIPGDKYYEPWNTYELKPEQALTIIREFTSDENN